MISPNKIEKNLEQTLQKDFPNYLVIRAKYLVPLTGLPINPNWRSDTHPLLEQIGVTAYGILKSLNFIYHRKRFIDISDFDQSFKNIYFHFGLIFDCVESLSRSILLIEQELGLIDINQKLKLTQQELINKYSDWVNIEYSKKYLDFIEKGKPIFFYPQNDHTYLSLIIRNPIKKNYNKFSRNIKDYRNFFIHNPGVDIFKEMPSGKLFTIKKEFVDKSKNWADLQFLFNLDKTYFEDPLNMIDNDLQSILYILNNIWSFLDLRLKKIYNHKKFSNLVRGFIREFDL